MKPQPYSIKPFAVRGSYVAVHRVLFTHVMPQIAPNAWKVLCFLLFKTQGHEKDWDKVAYSQIREGCGIGSDTTVRAALGELLGMIPVPGDNGKSEWMRSFDKPDLILCHTPSGIAQTPYYSLNPDVELFL